MCKRELPWIRGGRYHVRLCIIMTHNDKREREKEIDRERERERERRERERQAEMDDKGDCILMHGNVWFCLGNLHTCT